MIIKMLKIDSFAGIEKKIINFEKGLNLIYGENETGKSRIESYIKIMLYGLSPKRGKNESDRKKYLPFNNRHIEGELVVEHNGRDYLIKRSFGKTKKEDISMVLDYLTGEEEKNINKDEPGKYFLGINRATFEKTLYIGQLAVSFTKDKEEEIMDKITALLGCSEHEVPVAKALEKLESIKKEYVTTRGVGALDLLKKKHSSLLEERYEGYKLSEENLGLEHKLLEHKADRKRIINEIEKLEVYKKYLKRVNLQKEYKDITEYLKKSEELKKKEEEIKNDLENGKDIIDEAFIDDLKEVNRLYLVLLDKKEELNEELTKQNMELKDNEIELENYKFLDLFGENIKERLIEIKYEQKTLEDKISYMKDIDNSIVLDERELNNKRNLLGNIIALENIKEDIEEKFNLYDVKLRSIKTIAQSNDINFDSKVDVKKENFKVLIGGIFLAIGLAMFFFGMPFMIIGGISVITGATIILMTNSRKKQMKYKEKEIEKLRKEINSIEEVLDETMIKLKINDYGELITSIKKYSIYKEYEERILVRLEEKKKIIDKGEYEETLNKYNKNKEMIDSLIGLSSCKDLEEVLEAISIYSKISETIEAIKEKRFQLADSIKNINIELEIKEKKLKAKLEIMDLDLGNLLDIEIYIKEYKEKIKKKNEIHANLQSMEETYKVLLKDRDINEIKNELKDIINESNQYSYESEEEIEVEEKRKSKELIEIEKNIKDLENKIANRYIGKRDLILIEEEIEDIKSEIEKDEKKVKSLDIAIKAIEESFHEVRREVGPTLNNNIASIFKVLTKEKYEEIKLGENYEMMVRDKNNLFAGNYLSNGALDQLYLSLRLALIDILFNGEERTIILDDAFVQYDNHRREKALLLINEKIKGQGLIFTCHTLEKEILENNKIEYNLIAL
ncbi:MULTISPECIES: AAA family ATPase [Clostridium]|uniref:AAA family ATPase n=1 Tax=Clostridium cibarium TaxID=2762247 RepID=A0ABR8PR94_9CLOT|nr:MULTISPECIES: AAA family ATPase [Clostridium]MBD7910673.1 AAA family ATPase [Clostridium cibarium]